MNIFVKFPSVPPNPLVLVLKLRTGSQLLDAALPGGTSPTTRVKRRGSQVEATLYLDVGVGGSDRTQQTFMAENEAVFFSSQGAIKI